MHTEYRKIFTAIIVGYIFVQAPTVDASDWFRKTLTYIRTQPDPMDPQLNPQKIAFIGQVRDEIRQNSATAKPILDTAAFNLVVEASQEARTLHITLLQQTKSLHGPLTKEQQTLASAAVHKIFILAAAFKSSNDALLAAQEHARTTAKKDDPSIFCTKSDCWQINPCMNDHK